MLTKWRVIKKATWSDYDYIGIEFDMETGCYRGIRINMTKTAVRKRSTSPFEALENGSWETIPVADAFGFIHAFNQVRKAKTHFLPVTEADILALLYKIERLKTCNKSVTA